MGIGDVIAAQVRKYRLLKNWSVKRLAEECARLGAPQLTAPSLSNIERGQDVSAKRTRRRVLVEELAVLARALDVPPLLLVFPIGQGELVEVLPGTAVPGWAAAKWWTAEEPFPTHQGEHGWGSEESDQQAWQAAAAPAIYRRIHDRFVAKWFGVMHLDKPQDEINAVQRDAEAKLRDLRQNMRRAGIDPGEEPFFLGAHVPGEPRQARRTGDVNG